MDVQQLLISLVLFVWEGFVFPVIVSPHLSLTGIFFSSSWFCVLSCFSCRSNLYFFNNTIFLNMTDRVFLSLSTVSSYTALFSEPIYSCSMCCVNKISSNKQHPGTPFWLFLLSQDQPVTRTSSTNPVYCLRFAIFLIHLADLWVWGLYI